MGRSKSTGTLALSHNVSTALLALLTGGGNGLSSAFGRSIGGGVGIDWTRRSACEIDFFRKSGKESLVGIDVKSMGPRADNASLNSVIVEEN